MNAAQLRHASVIVGAVYARVRDNPHRAAVITIETALVESEMQVFANYNVPESMRLSHEAVGSDHDSVGIFQQRVPMWGSAADCMDPLRSTNKFLDRLLSFNWQSYSTGSAAQNVQGSAFPDRYQTREAEATRIVDAVKSGGTATDTHTATTLVFSEDQMVIIVAPRRGVAQLVDGGKYHLDPGEYAAHLEIRAKAPHAYVIAAISPARWDAMKDKRGKI